MYVWAKLPENLPNGWATRSIEFCTALVGETGVALSPGRGFGYTGEGYVRLALVQSPEVLATAVSQIGAFVDTIGKSAVCSNDPTIDRSSTSTVKTKA